VILEKKYFKLLETLDEGRHHSGTGNGKRQGLKSFLERQSAASSLKWLLFRD